MSMSTHSALVSCVALIYLVRKADFNITPFDGLSPSLEIAK